MKMQPVLLGGLFIGVLSSLPIVQAGNCCCCLWVVLGGILTVYLLQQQQPVAVDAGQGALSGALAGLIGGLIAAVAAFAIQAVAGTGYDQVLQAILADENLPPEARGFLEKLSGSVLVVVVSFTTIVGSAIFGMLGGLLGVAIFKKNAPPQPPTVIPHDPGLAQ